jgi:hypothetical protein
MTEYVIQQSKPDGAFLVFHPDGSYNGIFERAALEALREQPGDAVRFEPAEAETAFNERFPAGG